jgi:hypothetical protein
VVSRGQTNSEGIEQQEENSQRARVIHFERNRPAGHQAIRSANRFGTAHHLEPQGLVLVRLQRT